MSFQGSHMAFYLLAVIYTAYCVNGVAVLFLNLPDVLKIKERYKTHLAIVVIGLLFLVFKPIKLESQSDSERTQVRHSFDTPVYENNREVVKTSRRSYELSDIREEKEQSKVEWDSIQGEK